MPYRELVRASTPLFLPLGLPARLPMAMLPLAILLTVQGRTGDFELAGLVAATQSVSGIAGALLVGRLADRIGLRRLGVATTLLNALATAGLMASLAAAPWVLVLAAAAVGVTNPPVGPLVRTHWMIIFRDRPAQLDTAMSYEAAADELSFVLGPILVGLLVVVPTPIGPALPLGCAALLLVVAGVPFARGYADAPPGTGAPAARPRPVPAFALVGLMAGMAVTGAVFSATQIGVTGYAVEHGAPGQAGLLYALFALGNTGAGLASARLPQRIGLGRRYLIFAGGLLIGTTVLAAGAAGLLPLLVAMPVGGATVAPFMITVYRLAGQLCPDRTATVLTAVGAGGAFGGGAGQLLAGRLVTEQGSFGAFVLAPAAASVGLALAALYAAAHRRSG